MLLRSGAFAQGLAAWDNPGLRRELGHVVSASAPAGATAGLLRPAGLPVQAWTANLPEPRSEHDRRTPAVPVRRLQRQSLTFAEHAPALSRTLHPEPAPEPPPVASGSAPGDIPSGTPDIPGVPPGHSRGHCRGHFRGRPLRVSPGGAGGVLRRTTSGRANRPRANGTAGGRPGGSRPGGWGPPPHGGAEPSHRQPPGSRPTARANQPNGALRRRRAHARAASHGQPQARQHAVHGPNGATIARHHPPHPRTHRRTRPRARQCSRRHDRDTDQANAFEGPAGRGVARPASADRRSRLGPPCECSRTHRGPRTGRCPATAPPPTPAALAGGSTGALPGALPDVPGRVGGRLGAC